MKNKAVKNIAFIMLAVMLVSLIAIPAYADNTITTDKNSYAEGEAIYVTATGEGSDWVGVYLESDTVGNEPAILWYYVAKDGNASGGAKNVFTSENHASGRDELLSLPAGNYKICLCTNDSYNVAASVNITVAEAERQTVENKGVTCDKSEYTEGEAIMITAVGDGDDWVGVYKKGESSDTAYSIRWYYVAKEGNTSGSAKNLFDAEHTERADDADLKAGEYTIVLFENGGYTVIASVDITVSEPAPEPTGTETQTGETQTEEAPENTQTGDTETAVLIILALLSLTAIAAVTVKRLRACR